MVEKNLLKRRHKVDNGILPLVIFSLVMLTAIAVIYIDKSYDIRGRASDLYAPAPTSTPPILSPPNPGQNFQTGCSSPSSDPNIHAICGNYTDSNGNPYSCASYCRSIGRNAISVGVNLAADDNKSVSKINDHCEYGIYATIDTMIVYDGLCWDYNLNPDEAKMAKFLYCKCSDSTLLPSPTPLTKGKRS